MVETAGADVRVTACVCTRDRVGELRRSLPLLLESARRAPFAVEVLVVDNGSTDGTGDYLLEMARQHPMLHVVTEPEPGLSAARNHAAGLFRGEVLVFCDDDVRVPVGFVSAMAAPILAGRADACAGEVRLAPDLERPWMTASIRFLLAESLAIDTPQPPLVGASMAASRSLVQRLRWDPDLGAGRLGSGEDILFYLQAKALGARIEAVRDAPAVHHFGADRLIRESLITAAARIGRADAYIAHHWLGTARRGSRPRAVVLATLARLLDVAAARRRGRERASELELRVARKAGFHQQLVGLRDVGRRVPVGTRGR
jgi:glycosyltransferase involved in cell wall biosynthesis